MNSPYERCKQVIQFSEYPWRVVAALTRKNVWGLKDAQRYIMETAAKRKRGGEDEGRFIEAMEDLTGEKAMVMLQTFPSFARWIVETPLKWSKMKQIIEKSEKSSITMLSVRLDTRGIEPHQNHEQDAEFVGVGIIGKDDKKYGKWVFTSKKITLEGFFVADVPVGQWILRYDNKIIQSIMRNMDGSVDEEYAIESFWGEEKYSLTWKRGRPLTGSVITVNLAKKTYLIQNWSNGSLKDDVKDDQRRGKNNGKTETTEGQALSADVVGQWVYEEMMRVTDVSNEIAKRIEWNNGRVKRIELEEDQQTFIFNEKEVLVEIHSKGGRVLSANENGEWNGSVWVKRKDRERLYMLQHWDNGKRQGEWKYYFQSTKYDTFVYEDDVLREIRYDLSQDFYDIAGNQEQGTVFSPYKYNRRYKRRVFYPFLSVDEGEVKEERYDDEEDDFDFYS